MARPAIIAALAVFLAVPILPGAGAQAQTFREKPAVPTTAGHPWTGAMVYDREGLVVGPIDRLVRNGRIVNAEIIVWGHRSSVRLSTLRMRDDGVAVSTMRRYEIFLTFPGCNLC